MRWCGKKRGRRENDEEEEEKEENEKKNSLSLTHTQFCINPLSLSHTHFFFLYPFHTFLLVSTLGFNFRFYTLTSTSTFYTSTRFFLSFQLFNFPHNNKPPPSYFLLPSPVFPTILFIKIYFK